MTRSNGSSQSLPIVTTFVKLAKDWVGARQRAQIIAGALGFGAQDETRIATAVSEIARNAFEYAGGGRVEFIAETGTAQALAVRISDEGPGIADIADILAGRYRSPRGMGIGITGSRSLMDEFVVDTVVGKGTTVVLRKYLPRSAPRITPADLSRVAEALTRRPADPLEEAQHYNQELLRTLDELSRVNRELQSANEAKDLFLATVSHELRTPMTAILGWLQMLSLPGIDSDTRQEGLKAIEGAARVQARLVDDVLEAAKVQSGKLHLEVSDIDLRDVIDSTWSAARPAIAAKSIVFERVIHGGALPVRGDSERLQQVLWNLISNAIKFTPVNGSIAVRVSSDDRNAMIEVSDSGEGIAPDLLPHVFERFRQGGNARQHGGLGLGLAIVHHLVDLHGGAISAASDGPGKGARFTVQVPLNRPPG